MRYLFDCKNCGKMEVVMSYKDLPLLNCPQCGMEKPERIYTRFYTGNIEGFCGNSNTWNNSRINTKDK
jgi:putative FmdB family regulatory protein